VGNSAQPQRVPVVSRIESESRPQAWLLDDFEYGLRPYNVNGINGRLGNLLGWLDETAPDIVCLQELKAPDEKFPGAEEAEGRESRAREPGQ
jgi:hypothetical protein